MAQAVAVAALMGVAVPAAADELPAGRFGVVGGPRLGNGAFGDRFGWGWVWGMEAGYNPTDTDRNWSFGLAWSVSWGWFGADRPEINDGSLWLLEMSFGTRVRRLLGETSQAFLVGNVGVTVLRTNTPIPPENERSYWGPYAGIGVEGYAGSKLVGLEARYGVFAGGPGSLSILVGFSFGAG